jgi:hypothetical protein
MVRPQTARATDSNSFNAAVHESEWLATEVAAADASVEQGMPLDLAYFGCGKGQTQCSSPEDLAIVTQQALEHPLHSGAYTFDAGQGYPVRPFQYSQSTKQHTRNQLRIACQQTLRTSFILEDTLLGADSSVVGCVCV